MAVTINGNGTVTGLSALPSSAMTTGSVLQVVQTFKADSTSFTSNSSSTYADITGMSVTITPSSSSNKVLVSFVASVSTNSSDRNNSIKLLRGSTDICKSTAGSSLNATIVDKTFDGKYIMNFTQTFLDSPSTTSATTYKLQWAAEGSGGSSKTYYLNRKGDNSNEGATSTITAMEIKA
tara:strand:+ start:45 stop:581 length:537 start_codon:yes stop_codon:yes gene_type:complete